MSIFKKIKMYLNIIFILVALFFSAKFIYEKFNYFKTVLPYFSGKSLDEKYAIIDGDFYRFISFCKDKIPAGSEIIFYTPWNIYNKIYYNNAYFMSQYHKQKGKFYLYPIITHVFSPGGKKEMGTLWEITPDQESEILKRVSYIIVCFLDREFPGFKIQYQYDPNHYILIKEK